MRRVVVTGMGLVSCLGNAAHSVSRALREGISGIRHIPEYADLGLRSQVAGQPVIDLVAEIEACEPDAPAELTPPPVALEPMMEPARVVEQVAEPAAAPSAPRRRRDADVEAKARQGELPPPPDFSAPTHARFRAKLAALVELVGKADATGLRAIAINPVSSSPKALARYRDLAVLAIEARESRA